MPELSLAHTHDDPFVGILTLVTVNEKGTDSRNYGKLILPSECSLRRLTMTNAQAHELEQLSSLRNDLT